MLRKVLIIVTAAAISVFCLSGCKKRSGETKSGQEESKTMAEYRDEAKKQIDKENMAEELESIEKAMRQELSQQQ